MDNWLADDLFEALQDGAAVVDRDLKVLRVNRAFSRIFGADVPLLIGRDLAMLFPLAMLDAARAALGRGQAFVLRAQAHRPGSAAAGQLSHWDFRFAPLGAHDAALLCVHEVTAGGQLDHVLPQAVPCCGREAVDAEQRERARIAALLHDEVGQEITGLKLDIERNLGEATDPHRRRWAEALASVNAVLERLRQLSTDLGPPVLEDLGLVPALLWLVERSSRRSALAIEFSHAGLERRLPPLIETALFQIAQQAVNNAALHAGGGTVALSLRRTEDKIVLRVVDNGPGFDVDAVLRRGNGLGLYGIRHKIQALGGCSTIESVPGRGTTILVELPLPSHGV